MAFETSDGRSGPSSDDSLQPVKIVISGGFGVGKTTFVGSISEIDPLTTEAAMTSASVGVDDTSKVSTKTHTTVAMDFGRISLGGGLVLYLFGTPGQARFQFMWDDLARGAIGAVVMVDTRRLADCFSAVDYFEQLGLPYIVAVNCFEGIQFHEEQSVREALAVPADVPLVFCDARQRSSTKQTLVTLVEHALFRAEE
jgi:signal recognition particle receptor subunit beta